MTVDFKTKQREFSAYIRNPENNPRPIDVTVQRMTAYRELFFNNVDGFLSSNFPVLKTLLTELQWIELAQDFFEKHQCTSPYFVEIPEEFLDFLQNERQNSSDYPFLLELAHYEWVEMALSISKETIVVNPTKFIEQIEHQSLALSPLAWALAYQYPVQQISPDFKLIEPPEQPTFLLVYRNCDDEVHFIQIPAITFRLLSILDENKGISCQQCLQQIVTESGISQSENLMASGLGIIKELANKNIIIPSHLID